MLKVTCVCMVFTLVTSFSIGDYETPCRLHVSSALTALEFFIHDQLQYIHSLVDEWPSPLNQVSCKVCICSTSHVYMSCLLIYSLFSCCLCLSLSLVNTLLWPCWLVWSCLFDMWVCNWAWGMVIYQMWAYWASVFLGYFYLLQSTPETKGNSDPERGTNCNDVWSGTTELLPETHISP